jgi:hypothetical protein
VAIQDYGYIPKKFPDKLIKKIKIPDKFWVFLDSG